ncbi:hypothetical protein Scep_026489 [Stephania cephalantha]|uniref:Uncharacterized protein n=1 Tax=Stephania cephalantha TaxID=152367 RepID=A0AAP0EK84_9MAGN
MAKREKIGNGVVKNAGKESSALRDISSEEEMEEVEGNEKDSSIGNEGQVAQSGEAADQSDNESNGQVAIGGKAQSGEAAYQTDKENNSISSHSGLFIQGSRGEPTDDTFDDTFIPHTYPSSPKVYEEEGLSTKEGENKKWISKSHRTMSWSKQRSLMRSISWRTNTSRQRKN